MFLTGCGSRYHPVTGEIIFPDGSAVQGLAGGQIIFQKTGGSQSASGAIDANGKFSLSTEALGDGVAEGDYQLIITPPQSSGDIPLPQVIDPKYTRPGGSTETFTVKVGTNHFKVKVEPARP